MAAKYIVILALAVVASALPVVPVANPNPEPEAPTHYDIQYSVHDENSGDVKKQQESGAADVVHESYSLVQPDGVHRIVEYTAKAEQGFNPNVRYERHPVETPAPAKIAYAAPVDKIAYAAPLRTAAHFAPIYNAAQVAKIAYASPFGQFSFSSPVISYF